MTNTTTTPATTTATLIAKYDATTNPTEKALIAEQLNEIDFFWDILRDEPAVTPEPDFSKIDEIAANGFCDTRESIITGIIETIFMNKTAVCITDVKIVDNMINYVTLYTHGRYSAAISVYEVVDNVEPYLLAKQKKNAKAMRQFEIDNIMAYGTKAEKKKLQKILAAEKSGHIYSYEYETWSAEYQEQ